jgi:predicted O-methyltransferase YrrM
MIHRANAEALHEAVLAERPNTVVEVGMAYGASSLAILGALDELGSGQLISVDPNQRTQWEGRGLAVVAEAGFSERHQLIEEPSYLALPELLRRGQRLDLAYVDGWHTFDYALLDFFYLDRMLGPGGVVGFNDCGWPSVEKVLRYVLANRPYEETDVGLAPRWITRKRWHRVIARRVNTADRYLRKVDDSEPGWDFFADF